MDSRVIRVNAQEPLGLSGRLVPVLTVGVTVLVVAEWAVMTGWACTLSLPPGPHGSFYSHPAEVQLKPKHQPYKVGRQWPELLLRFTDAPDDDVAMGQCCSGQAELPWLRGRPCISPRLGQPLLAGEMRCPGEASKGGWAACRARW